MPDPTELLCVARLLADPGAAPPSDARLRRAVSTAYYAVFHKVLRAAAQRFIGPNQEQAAGYGILYRGYDHRRMREVCDALQPSTLRDKYKHSLQRSAVSEDMRDFASIFSDLQDARHRADYDPMHVLSPSDVSSQIDAAEVAIEAFDRVMLDEQAAVLALMLVGARG